MKMISLEFYRCRFPVSLCIYRSFVTEGKMWNVSEIRDGSFYQVYCHFYDLVDFTGRERGAEQRELWEKINR